MEHSKAHKSRIRKHFKGVDRKALVRKLKTSHSYIDQVATGHKVVSALRAVTIAKFTGGMVPASILRPDIFNY